MTTALRSGTRARLLFAGVLAAVLAGPAVATGVYRWTDAQGRVHYGDLEKIPADRRATARPIDTRPALPAPPADAVPRELPTAPAPVAAPEPAPARSLGGARPAAAAAGPATPPAPTCEQRWQAYRDSVACFDRFRVGGKVRPEGFQHCSEVLRPAERC